MTSSGTRGTARGTKCLSEIAAESNDIGMLTRCVGRAILEALTDGMKGPDAAETLKEPACGFCWLNHAGQPGPSG